MIYDCIANRHVQLTGFTQSPRARLAIASSGQKLELGNVPWVERRVPIIAMRSRLSRGMIM